MNSNMAAVRTTLVLERQRLVELKKLALAQNRTLSSVVDEFLREGLSRQQSPLPKPPPLPSFKMGKPSVDLADRDRLMDLLDG